MSKFNGWLSIYKPKGISSFKALKIIQKKLDVKKLGHGGTLDPLAEGVLPVGFGEALKAINFCQDMEKQYEFEVQFGKETTTLDAEGEVTKVTECIPAKEDIIKVLPEFIGQINQVPPIYSALKVNGQKAYKLARDGEVVNLPPREVLIKSLDLISYSQYSSTAKFVVVCGKGTYVRSLARDIALKAGSLGFVTELKRTKVGVFNLNNSHFIDCDNFNERIEGNLLPCDIVLNDISVLELEIEQMHALRQGKKLNIPGSDTELLRCYSNEQFFAIATLKDSILKTKRIFNL